MSFVSIISIPCLVWVLLILLLGRKWQSLTHRVTIVLAVNQLICAVGGYMWQFVNQLDPHTCHQYFVFHAHYIFSVAGKLIVTTIIVD